eukprot:634335-Pleurochrysis_carterae.AAC.1
MARTESVSRGSACVRCPTTYRPTPAWATARTETPEPGRWSPPTTPPAPDRPYPSYPHRPAAMLARPPPDRPTKLAARLH